MRFAKRWAFHTTFTDWVNGKTYPRIDKIEMLANYFGIKKSDLIEDKSAQREATEEERREIEAFKKYLISKR